MVDLKELGEGLSLGGVYTLEHCIRQDNAGTFFAAWNEAGERVLIKLVPEQAPEAERQFATWQRCRHLRHEHLQDLRDVGRGGVAGESYVYGVFEYPDDVLASALEQGPVSEPETLGVLDAALAALRYLHGQGLVHGAVDPDHIVAVGETVKLATDGLRESDDLEGHPEDVRQLGELVRTLRAPEPLSEPLATMVEHATATEARQRWTLAEIARVIAPPPAPPVMPVAAPPEPAPEPTPPPVAATLAPPMPARAVEELPRAFPKWIIAGVAIALLLLFRFNLRREPEAAPAAAAAVSQPLPPPAPSTPPAAPAVPATWRVIAFTYRSRDIAAKKVKQINTRWPDLHAAVFEPKGLRGYYLVALGSAMSRDGATRLQRRARGLGLPRDTYVQNYTP